MTASTRSSLTGVSGAMTSDAPNVRSALDEPEQRAAVDRRRRPHAARRQHDDLGHRVGPLEVVDGQRPVGERERREQRVVGAERAVAGEVDERRGPDELQRGRRGGRRAGEHHRRLVAPGELVHLLVGEPEARPGDEPGRCAEPRSARAPGRSAGCVRPCAERRADRDGATARTAAAPSTARRAGRPSARPRADAPSVAPPAGAAGPPGRRSPRRAAARRRPARRPTPARGSGGAGRTSTPRGGRRARPPVPGRAGACGRSTRSRRTGRPPGWRTRAAGARRAAPSSR